MSLFSQSLQIGYNTLIDLENVEKRKSTQSSELEIIEESPPTNKTTSRRFNSKCQMTGYKSMDRKKKKFDRSKSDSALETSISTSKSSKINLKDQENCTTDFKSSIPNLTAIQLHQSTEVLSNDYKNLSNFFESEMEFNKINATESDDAQHKNSSENSCNLTNKIAQQSIDQIAWDESDDAFNILENNSNFIRNDNNSTVIDDAIALGIDNVTFTQDFLQFDQNSENNICNVSKFMKTEIENCKKQVKSNLKETELDQETKSCMNPIFNSENSISKIVLNVSDDSTNSNNENLSLHKLVSSSVNDIKTTYPQNSGKLTGSTLTSNFNDIRNWGLPETVLKQYKQKGIDTMFDWQCKCLSNKKVITFNYIFRI